MLDDFRTIEEARAAISESVFGKMVNVRAIEALFNFVVEAALDRRAALEAKSEELPEYLTKKQAAKYLSCSIRSIDNRIQEGKLSVERDGRNVRIPRVEVEKIFTI